MKVLLFAGALSALGAPMASAATTECETENLRRHGVEVRQSATAGAPEMARADVERTPPPRQETRRRTAKGIPDAELIGGRGTL